MRLGSGTRPWSAARRLDAGSEPVGVPGGAGANGHAAAPDPAENGLIIGGVAGAMATAMLRNGRPVGGSMLVAPFAAAAAEVPLRRARAQFERDYIAYILARYGGNATRAARALGISRVMLHRKIRDYGLRRK